jgi:uncharacterized phage-associated protein
MATVFDVAKYISDNLGEMTAMKLQKLCYYAQAWTLAWDEAQLFDDEFEAWENGPVCPELFEKHRRRLVIPVGFFDDCAKGELSGSQRENIDIVLRDYGHYEPHELSSMTHRERPWREARGDLPLGEPCNKAIPKERMRDYYSGLLD